MKKNILIFGSNGFSGQYLRKYIEEERSAEFNLFGCDIQKAAVKSNNFYCADLISLNNVKKLIKEIKPEYIVNCAGTYNNSDFRRYYNINVLISTNIYQAILNIGNINPRILIIGSAAEYGAPIKLPVKESQSLNPLSFYGWVKTIQTYQALYYNKNFKLKILIARPFNLLGPGLSETLSISSFCSQVFKNRNNNKSLINAGNLNSKRDFIDIRDAVKGYMDILIHGQAGEVYNICYGKSKKLKDIVSKIIKLSELKVTLKYDKNRIRKNDIGDIYGSFFKLYNLSGWKPKISLETTLNSMLEYWKDQNHF